MIVALILLAVAVVLAPHRSAGLPPAPEIALVKAQLSIMQQRSFAADREFCGYLLRDAAGRLTFTPMLQGHVHGCTPEFAVGGATPVASIHTHGAYAASVPAEFPTSLDMDSDAAEGVNGYIATPGGRLWFIDGQARVAVQICGMGCLPQDPAFQAGDDGEIAIRYTYQELLDLELLP